MAKNTLVFDDGSTLDIDFDKEVNKIKSDLAGVLDFPGLPDELRRAIEDGLDKEEK